MELLKNGVDLYPSLERFLATSSNVFIYAAYVKLEPLKLLLEKCHNVVAVTVRWNKRDLLLGASDLDVYEYLNKKGIALYRNPRLHAKAFVDDFRRCFTGSANISSRALNIPETNCYNYELACRIDSLGMEDQLYFYGIDNSSLLVTGSILSQIQHQLEDCSDKLSFETDFTLQLLAPDKNFLTTSLPMSRSLTNLRKIYEANSVTDATEVKCAMHDLALYDLPLGLPTDIFLTRIKAAFWSHPFVRQFTLFLEEKRELYFGQVKEWLQRNCADVPTPRRWELTENVQILYRWITELSEGRYAVDRPNYSERLYVVNQ